jgi:hypothetical protein
VVVFKELLARAKLGDVVYLFVERFRLFSGFGAVGKKHTTAAGWEGLRLRPTPTRAKTFRLQAEEH